MIALLLLLYLAPQEPAAGSVGQEPAPQTETATQDGATDAAEATEPADLPFRSLDEIEAEQTGEELDLGGMYVRTFGYLLVVLGLILVAAYAVKRFMPKQIGSFGQGDRMRVIQSMPLGSRRHLSLVEVDGKRLLVGVTEHQINLIKDMDANSFEDTMRAVEEPRTVREWEEEAS